MHPQMCMRMIGCLPMSCSDVSRGVECALSEREAPIRSPWVWRPWDGLLARVGSDEACIRATVQARNTVHVVMAYWTIVKSSRKVPSKGHQERLLRLLSAGGAAPPSSPYCSRRGVCRALGVSFCSPGRAVRSTFVIPSHRSHGSLALPQSALRTIISEKISETRTSKHGFARSSGGSNKGRIRFTRIRHQATSFSRCLRSVSAPRGTGSRA